MKKIIFFILVALFTFCTTSAFAQIEYNYISDIEITGNINVTTQLIKSASGLALGQIFSPDKVTKAIQNIYKLGLFSDIQIDKVQNDKGVKIIIQVSEYPIVQEWEITGNKKIRLDDIKKYFRLVRGDYWSGERQLEIKNKILELYYSKGYRLAAVNFKEEPALSNRIELTIVINEGHKVVIREINFTGNEQISNKKLRRIIKTKKSGFLRSGEFDQEKFDEDLIRIVGYYNSKGYIDAAVIGWEPRYDENGQLFISINLYEGNQYRIGDISIEGNTLFSNEMLLHQLKFEKDEIFNREEFDEKLNGIRSMYYEEGYIYSTVSPQI
ncbi:outer membrane protein assembly factor BamA, partial [bacterium]|nr:outer membrane protein assembly factor BamA [bacterium]